jgi:hypothetical protein
LETRIEECSILVGHRNQIAAVRIGGDAVPELLDQLETLCDVKPEQLRFRNRHGVTVARDAHRRSARRSVGKSRAERVAKFCHAAADPAGSGQTTTNNQQS